MKSSEIKDFSLFSHVSIFHWNSSHLTNMTNLWAWGFPSFHSTAKMSETSKIVNFFIRRCRNWSAMQCWSSKKSYHMFNEYLSWTVDWVSWVDQLVAILLSILDCFSLYCTVDPTGSGSIVNHTYSVNQLSTFTNRQLELEFTVGWQCMHRRLTKQYYSTVNSVLWPDDWQLWMVAWTENIQMPTLFAFIRMETPDWSEKLSEANSTIGTFEQFSNFLSPFFNQYLSRNSSENDWNDKISSSSLTHHSFVLLAAKFGTKKIHEKFVEQNNHQKKIFTQLIPFQ